MYSHGTCLHSDSLPRDMTHEPENPWALFGDCGKSVCLMEGQVFTTCENGKKMVAAAVSRAWSCTVLPMGSLWLFLTVYSGTQIICGNIWFQPARTVSFVTMRN